MIVRVCPHQRPRRYSNAGGIENRKESGWHQTASPRAEGSFGKARVSGEGRRSCADRPLLAQCRENGVEVVTDITMSELGKACGIAVSSAAAAIVR